MSIFSGKRGREAAMQASQYLSNGATQAYGFLDDALGEATKQSGKAATTLGDLAGSYGKGSALYQDALGVNGADAAGTARAAYQTSPGYQFQLDQGLEGLARARAVSGTLASGGAETDAMRYATGLASQDYNNWLSNLSNLDTKRYGATTAEAGTYGDLARLTLGTGATKAGVAQQTAQGIAGAAFKAAEAGDRAASNRFGAIMGGANLLAGLAGKAFGGGLGGGLGGAFSIFGGGGDGGLGIGKDSDWV